MKKYNLNYILSFLSNNLWPVIGALVIVSAAVITLFTESQAIVVTVTATISALILLWYTLETQRMRKEMVSQNEISIMPVLILRIDEEKKRLLLENQGNFPAFDVNISGGSSEQPIAELERVDPNKKWCELDGFDLLASVDSAVPKDKKPLYIHSLKAFISDDIGDDHEQEVPYEEWDSFISDYLIPSLMKWNDVSFTVTFKNILGNRYAVEMGLGIHGTHFGIPKRVKNSDAEVRI
jgi:hypothetical protein